MSGLKRKLEDDEKADPDEPQAKRCKVVQSTKTSNINDIHDHCANVSTEKSQDVVTTTSMSETLDETEDDDILGLSKQQMINTANIIGKQMPKLENDNDNQAMLPNVVTVQIGTIQKEFDINELKSIKLSYFEARLDKRWNNNTGSNNDNKFEIIVSDKETYKSLGFEMKDFEILLAIGKCGKISFKYPCTKEFLEGLLFCNDFFGREIINEKMLIEFLLNYKPAIMIKQRKEWLLSVKNDFFKSVLTFLNEKCSKQVTQPLSKSREAVIHNFTPIDDETLVSLFIAAFDFELVSIVAKKRIEVYFPRDISKDDKFKHFPHWSVSEIWFQITYRKLHEQEEYWNRIYNHLIVICDRYDNIEQEIEKMQTPITESILVAIGASKGDMNDNDNININADAKVDVDVVFGCGYDGVDLSGAMHSVMFDIALFINHLIVETNNNTGDDDSSDSASTSDETERSESSDMSGNDHENGEDDDEESSDIDVKINENNNERDINHLKNEEFEDASNASEENGDEITQEVTGGTDNSHDNDTGDHEMKELDDSDTTTTEKQQTVERLVTFCFEWMIKIDKKYKNCYRWYKNIIPLLPTGKVKSIFTSMIKNDMIKCGNTTSFDNWLLFADFFKYGEFFIKVEQQAEEMEEFEEHNHNPGFVELIQHENFVKSWLKDMMDCILTRKHCYYAQHSCCRWWCQYLQSNLDKESITNMFIKLLQYGVQLRGQMLTFFVKHSNMDVVLNSNNNESISQFVLNHITDRSCESWLRNILFGTLLTKKQISLLIIKIMEKNDEFFTCTYMHKSHLTRLLNFLKRCDIEWLVNQDTLTVIRLLIRLIVKRDSSDSSSLEGMKWIKKCVNTGIISGHSSVLLFKQLCCNTVESGPLEGYVSKLHTIQLKTLLFTNCDHDLFDQIRQEMAQFMVCLMDISYVEQYQALSYGNERAEREKFRLKKQQVKKCLLECEDIVLSSLSPADATFIFSYLLNQEHLRFMFQDYDQYAYGHRDHDTYEKERMKRYLSHCCKDENAAELQWLADTLYNFVARKCYREDCVSELCYPVDSRVSEIEKWVLDILMKEILTPSHVSKLAVRLLKGSLDVKSDNYSPFALCEFKNGWAHDRELDRFLHCMMDTCDIALIFCDEDAKFVEQLILLLLVQKEGKFQDSFVNGLERGNNDLSGGELETIAIRIANVIRNSIMDHHSISQKLMEWVNDKIDTNFVSAKGVIAQQSIWPNET